MADPIDTAGEAAAAKQSLITPQGVIDMMTAAVNDAAGSYRGNVHVDYPDAGRGNEYFKMLEESFSNTQKAQAKAQTDFDAASEEAAKSERDLGGAKKATIDANQERVQRVADQANYFNDLFGVSGNADRIAEKAIMAQQLNDDADKMLANIQGLKSANFFDNPIDWVVNQMALPSAIGEYNVVAKRVNGLESDISTSISAASGAEQINERSIPTITAQQAQAAGTVEVINAKKNAAQMDQERAAKDGDFAARQFGQNAAMEGAAAQKSAEELKLAHMKWQEKIENIRTAQSDSERKLRIAALGEALLDKAETFAMLQSYDQITGRLPGSTSMAFFNRASQNQREIIMGIAANAGGLDPGDAYNNLEDVGIGPNASEQTRAYLRTVNQYRQQMQNSQEFKQLQKKEDKQAFLRAGVNKKIVSLEQNPQADRANNPFYELSPKLMFAANPALQESVVGDIMKQYEAAPLAPDTATIIATFRKAIPDLNLASMAIAQYYSMNVLLRDKVANFGVLGVRTTGSYNYTWAPKGNVFENPVSIDLTKPTMVQNLLGRMQANENMDKMLTNPNPDLQF